MSGWRVGVASAALWLLAPPAAHAAPGDLDRRFGVAGHARTPAGAMSSATAVAFLPDGRLVVAGVTAGRDPARPDAESTRLLLLRYERDGRLDPTFGVGGVVVTEVGQYARPQEVFVQRDGRLLVAGATVSGDGAAPNAPNGTLLARYLPDGTPDASFGDGGVSVTPTPGTRTYVRAAAQAPDGRVVLVGDALRGYRTAFVRRFGADGRPDASFGTGGYVRPRFSAVTVNEAAGGVVALADGSVVVAGQTVLPRLGTTPFLARYDRNGTRDRAFGTTGIRGVTGTVHDLARTPDGGYVAAGTQVTRTGAAARAAVFVARFLPDGRLDPAFGTRGLHVRHVGTDAFPLGVAVARDGKVVVAGLVWNGTADALLLRLTRTGRADAAFGTGGVAGGDSGVDDLANAVAVAPAGTLVTAGASWVPGGAAQHVAVARYLG